MTYNNLNEWVEAKAAKKHPEQWYAGCLVSKNPSAEHYASGLRDMGEVMKGFDEWKSDNYGYLKSSFGDHYYLKSDGSKPLNVTPVYTFDELLLKYLNEKK